MHRFYHPVPFPQFHLHSSLCRVLLPQFSFANSLFTCGDCNSSPDAFSPLLIHFDNLFALILIISVRSFCSLSLSLPLSAHSSGCLVTCPVTWQRSKAPGTYAKSQVNRVQLDQLFRMRSLCPESGCSGCSVDALSMCIFRFYPNYSCSEFTKRKLIKPTKAPSSHPHRLWRVISEINTENIQII